MLVFTLLTKQVTVLVVIRVSKAIREFRAVMAHILKLTLFAISPNRVLPEHKSSENTDGTFEGSEAQSIKKSTHIGDSAFKKVM